MDRMMFERFLDNLEIYFDVRQAYKKKARALYDEQPDDYAEYLLEESEESDVLDNQIDILQNIFEHMIGDNSGSI